MKPLSFRLLGRSLGWLLVATLGLGLPACGASAGGALVAPGTPAGGASTTSGGDNGRGTDGAGTNGSGSGAASSDVSGSGSAAGTSGGSSGSAGATSGTAGSVSATTLTGSLAFPAAFAGELYGLLPDGGADLSNLDCRISDGQDLLAECGPQVMDTDGGLTPSKRILDIYITTPYGPAQPAGNADVDQADGTVSSVDGGAFATIELTWLENGAHVVMEALEGSVTYQATAAGMSGSFEASFLYEDGGLGTLAGTFGAPYCTSLSGY